MEKTLVIIKPDAIERGLIGEIINRFEKKGLKLSAMKMEKLSEELLEKHYGEHKGKDFYEPLITFMQKSEVVLMIISGECAVSVVRKMMGKTFGAEAELGTIRGDFGLSNRYNLVHGSDSLDSSQKEINLFFN